MEIVNRVALGEKEVQVSRSVTGYRMLWRKIISF